MPTIVEKIKDALNALETASKALHRVDEDHTALSAVQAMLDLRRGEVASTEQRLEQLREEMAKADADHARWCDATAKQQANGNREVDRLNAKRQALEEQVAEAQARHSNILQGIAALTARLKV